MQTGHENVEKTNGQYIKTVKYYQIQDDKYHSQFIEEETIGQYTGLKDKNGKEIYEGDIVYFNYREPQRHEIIFEDGSFWLKDKDSQCISMHEVKEICSGASNFYVEVMGNSFNNPELLKEE